MSALAKQIADAINALNSNNPVEAFEILKKAQKDNPLNPEIQFLLGKTYMAFEMFQNAVDFFENACRLGTNQNGSVDTVIWYYKGYCYFQIKQYTQAIEELNVFILSKEILLKNSNNIINLADLTKKLAEAYKLRAICHRKGRNDNNNTPQNIKEIIEDLLNSKKYDNTDEEVYIELIDLYLEINNFEIARQTASEIIRKKPSSILYQLRAQIYQKMEKYIEAKEDYETAMNLSQPQKRLYHDYAEVLKKLYIYIRSRFYFSQALTLEIEDKDMNKIYDQSIQNNISEINSNLEFYFKIKEQYEKNNYKDVINIYKKNKKPPSCFNPALLIFTGIAYFSLGNLAEAKNFLELAIKNGSKSCIVYSLLGKIYISEKEPETRVKALEFFNKAIEIDADYPEIYEYRALFHQKSGKDNLADQDKKKLSELRKEFSQKNSHEQKIIKLRRKIEIDPYNAELIFNRGISYLQFAIDTLINKSKNYELRSLSAFESAEKNFENANYLAAASANDALAICYFYCGNYQEALKCFNSVSEDSTAPFHDIFYLQRAVCLWKTKNTQAALNDFSKGFILGLKVFCDFPKDLAVLSKEKSNDPKYINTYLSYNPLRIDIQNNLAKTNEILNNFLNKIDNYYNPKSERNYIYRMAIANFNELCNELGKVKNSNFNANNSTVSKISDTKSATVLVTTKSFPFSNNHQFMQLDDLDNNEKEINEEAENIDTAMENDKDNCLGFKK